MQRNIIDGKLENLYDQMMSNNATEMELHYDVTIELIGIIRDQQHEINELRAELGKLHKESTKAL